MLFQVVLQFRKLVLDRPHVTASFQLIFLTFPVEFWHTYTVLEKKKFLMALSGGMKQELKSLVFHENVINGIMIPLYNLVQWITFFKQWIFLLMVHQLILAYPVILSNQVIFFFVIKTQVPIWQFTCLLCYFQFTKILQILFFPSLIHSTNTLVLHPIFSTLHQPN